MLVIAAAVIATSPASGLPGLGSLRISADYSPGHPTAGKSVTFTVTASDADGIVERVLLCYGDDTCGQAAYSWTTQDRVRACALGANYTGRFMHAYSHTATYHVTLVVVSTGCPGLEDEQETTAYDLRVG